jgi:ABC-2 type transport system permease protein
MQRTLRSLYWSFWLGWQIETNWADPSLFVLYLLIKPLTGSLLLVFMYQAAFVATQGGVRPELLAFAYLGNAIYMLVGAVSAGMSGAVVSDREHYGMLKYIRITPISLQVYLVGRGLAGGLEGLVAALLTIGAGLLLPVGLWDGLRHQDIAWGWLLFYLLLGPPMLVSLGLILSGLVLNMARHGMFLSEGVGSALYLLCGAVFPLEVLPGWLQGVALMLPPTYLVEGVRRALLGPSSASHLLRTWQPAELTLALLGSTVVLGALAQVLFAWNESRARRLGRYDQTTGF